MENVNIIIAFTSNIEYIKSLLACVILYKYTRKNIRFPLHIRSMSMTSKVISYPQV